MTDKPKGKFDCYQATTDAILEAMAAGIVPWRRPWKLGVGDDGLHRNAISRKAYRGGNVFLLDMIQLCKNYRCRQWLTFKQAKAAGGTVRKGEKGSRVYFWKFFDSSSETKKDGTPKQIAMMRLYTVFNLEQCDGVTFEPVPVPDFDSIERAERIVAQMPLRPALSHGGDRAFYRHVDDTVHMPHPGAFQSNNAYYHMLFHELAHSTGHESRLDRDTIGSASFFGDANYGREELVAELGSCMVARASGLECDIEASAAYIEGWQKRLTNDPRAFVWAAGKAQRAADWILNTATEKTDAD